MGKHIIPAAAMGVIYHSRAVWSSLYTGAGSWGAGGVGGEEGPGLASGGGGSPDPDLSWCSQGTGARAGWCETPMPSLSCLPLVARGEIRKPDLIPPFSLLLTANPLATFLLILPLIGSGIYLLFSISCPHLHPTHQPPLPLSCPVLPLLLVGGHSCPEGGPGTCCGQ